MIVDSVSAGCNALAGSGVDVGILPFYEFFIRILFFIKFVLYL